MKICIFSKGLERLLITLLCLSSILFTGCGNDNDEGNGESEKADYIEVTINGKTFRESVPNYLYAVTGTDTNGLDISFSTVDCFMKKGLGFSCFYGLVHSTRYTDLANAELGTYNVVNDINNNVKLFDFFIDYDNIGDDKCYESESGTNIITSIIPQQENNAVIVEGRFDAKMLEINSYESFRMKGKYRITVFCN